MSTLHQNDEEGCLIHLRRCLPTSIRGNQAVPHASACSCSSGSEKPFLIYVRAMDHSLGTLLAQNNDQGHEQVIYYGAEHRYNQTEKECLALVFAIQKMRHYLVGQTIHVISKVILLRLFKMKPYSLNGRLTK